MSLGELKRLVSEAPSADLGSRLSSRLGIELKIITDETIDDTAFCYDGT